MLRLCFVCHGNICRSPTAAGVMSKLVEDARLEDRIQIDSAGTSDYHVGEPPDRRATMAAERAGFRLDGEARQFQRTDFDAFDYVLAMDRDNYEDLLSLARSPADRQKVYLLRQFDRDAKPGASVPDPYYGGAGGFDEVLKQCERACRGLLDHLVQNEAR